MTRCRCPSPLFAFLVACAALTHAAAAQAVNCRSGTPAEAKALAEAAAALLDREGPNEAFKTFMDVDSPFIDLDLYVFVLDMRGTLWVNGAFPASIGSNARNARDKQGRYYVRAMIRLAEEEGQGWVEYEWYNPCTGELAPKAAYIKRVGPFIVAVGAYDAMST